MDCIESHWNRRSASYNEFVVKGFADMRERRAWQDHFTSLLGNIQIPHHPFNRVLHWGIAVEDLRHREHHDRPDDEYQDQNCGYRDSLTIHVPPYQIRLFQVAS